MKIDTIIYWVRSSGPEGKDRVPMYYKGRCDARDEGRIYHDIKARPVSLGPGKYTGVYGETDFEYEDDTPVQPVT